MLQMLWLNSNLLMSYWVLFLLSHWGSSKPSPPMGLTLTFCQSTWCDEKFSPTSVYTNDAGSALYSIKSSSIWHFHWQVSSLSESANVQSFVGGWCFCRGWMMSTHASVLVDSVRPPSAEVCRTAASFP
jgi:hypothetical protein